MEPIRFQRVIDYIEENLTQELSCDTIASLLAVSEADLQRSFKTVTGMTISCSDDAAAAGEALIRMGAKAVLIKGGHMESSIVVTDCLCQAGQAPKFLPQPKVETNNNHGTGCTLSAAIATGLGHGLPLQVAVTRAQEFLNLALRKSYAPGKGCGPVNHAARR